MSDQEKELRVLRDQIDQIDQQIQSLLNQRALCAQQVAEVKQKHQGQGDAVFYRPEREAQVLRRVMARNSGPLPAQDVARLFREIMSVCLALEQPMRIAFLGPEGTFTQQAAVKHFGLSAITAPLGTLDEVFREVEAGTAHYGVVPVENSNEGMVNHTLDLFGRFQLSIVGEVELKIHHHLLMKAGADRHHVTRIYATQQALAQCRRWLDAHYPSVERITVATNADAARQASADAEVGLGAAIGTELAIELYPLQVAVRNVEDQAESSSRFLILGRQEVGPSGKDKTSLLICAHDKPGALYELLAPFRARGISLTRIETRTLSGPWNMVFYIDFEGHVADPEVQALIKELESESVELKLLGSYPQAVL
ncbi:prephenate dehydratase [Marinobacterium nitratireducens]|nr:prephenate dehydratase [Marinobacterium nitratireducens]